MRPKLGRFWSKFEDRSVRKTVPFKYRSFYERFHRSVRFEPRPFRSKYLGLERSRAERNGNERSMNGTNGILTVRTVYERSGTVYERFKDRSYTVRRPFIDRSKTVHRPLVTDSSRSLIN